MDMVVTALWGLAAAFVSALGAVLIPIARDYATNLLQRRIGDAAGRVAGEIAGMVASDPRVTAATDAMLREGVEALKARVPDAIRKAGASDGTLRGMIVGEVGRILAPAVQASLGTGIATAAGTVAGLRG